MWNTSAQPSTPTKEMENNFCGHQPEWVVGLVFSQNGEKLEGVVVDFVTTVEFNAIIT